MRHPGLKGLLRAGTRPFPASLETLMKVSMHMIKTLLRPAMQGPAQMKTKATIKRLNMPAATIVFVAMSNHLSHSHAASRNAAGGLSADALAKRAGMA